MFKAIHNKTDAPIISLDPVWAERVDELRRLSRSDALACPECRAPVRFRRCERRRSHFAHKHKANCPYAAEPPELLAARAVLYEWLAKKNWGTVSIEHSPEDVSLPRSVDCWLETDRGTFAYWVLPVRLSPKRRKALREAARKCDAVFHWILLLDVLQEYPKRNGGAMLSTTEREFMQHCEYDLPHHRGAGDPGRSLHYLDQRNEQLITHILGFVSAL